MCSKDDRVRDFRAVRDELEDGEKGLRYYESFPADDVV